MKRFVVFGLCVFGWIVGCQKDADDVISAYASADEKVKDFVWKGLNQWYLWQGEVPDLADNRFGKSPLNANADNDAYVRFLSSFQSPETLFNHLNHPDDRFSIIVEDYRKLEQYFQGITLTTGIEYGFALYNGGANVVGYVKYVLPNSEAHEKGVKRGDIFTTIDGQLLTRENLRNLLYSNASSLRFGFATIDVASNSFNFQKEIVITQKELQENPIHLHKIHEVGGKKVGYLLYNSFVSGYDETLNEVFARFKAENITDLVLDLRYNGGGSVQSAIYLASMITGSHTGEIFVKQRSNAKLASYFKDYRGDFVDNIVKKGATIPLNKLHLKKLFVLTSSNTASASELIINGLKPFIEVVQIGGKTTGKNTASVTIYDSPAMLNKENINPSHTWAMQPIILISENANGFGAYQDGLQPNFPLTEKIEELGDLGEESDPFFRRAMDIILSRPFASPLKNTPDFLPLEVEKNNPLSKEMYLTP